MVLKREQVLERFPADSTERDNGDFYRELVSHELLLRRCGARGARGSGVVNVHTSKTLVQSLPVFPFPKLVRDLFGRDPFWLDPASVR